MTRAKSLWSGSRRRDAKIRFEVLSSLMKTQPPPARRSNPPALARPSAQRAPTGQPPPPQPAAEESDEELRQAVALRRTPRHYIHEWLVRRSTFGATDEEIQAALQLDPGTARARRGELVRMKLVVDSGTKRKTRAGRPARVWLAASVGEAVAATP